MFDEKQGTGSDCDNCVKSRVPLVPRVFRVFRVADLKVAQVKVVHQKTAGKTEAGSRTRLRVLTRTSGSFSPLLVSHGSDVRRSPEVRRPVSGNTRWENKKKKEAFLNFEGPGAPFSPLVSLSSLLSIRRKLTSS